MANVSVAQTDTLNLLLGSDWQVEGDWFGSEKVILKPIDKLPDIKSKSISNQEKEKRIEIWREKMDGERLSFYDQGNLYYTYNIYCPVGETLKDVRSFTFRKGLVFVEFKKWRWNEKVENYQSLFYEVNKWAKDEIILTIKK